MKIRIGAEGHIVNSSRNGHSVRIDDGQKNTGGFLVYEWWSGSDGPNDNGAFDTWVENEAALEKFFTESKWALEWKSQ